jgi:3-oxoacyl-[acyl-carrier protein] reductase
VNLQGQVAIVTGAGRGIGRAIALKLGTEGYRVVVTARTAVELEQVVREIQAEGGGATPIALDLREPAAAGRIVEHAVKEFGSLGILINNAGATRRGEFVRLTDEDWADSFALKFFGAVRLTRAAWPHLKAANGSVVFISGAGGRTPGAEFAAGGTVNAALLSLTKALAEAGLQDGIQVNAINPGAVRTGRLSQRLAAMVRDLGIEPAKAEQRFVQDLKVTRIGEPQDIANLVAFVVGPGGRFLHGSLIDMDGGATKTI